mgnify:CR=1 FL=1
MSASHYKFVSQKGLLFAFVGEPFPDSLDEEFMFLPLPCHIENAIDKRTDVAANQRIDLDDWEVLMLWIGFIKEVGGETLQDALLAGI